MSHNNKPISVNFMPFAENGMDTQGDQMQAMVQQVKQMLDQGVNPQEVIIQLLQSNVDPNAVVQIMSSLGIPQEEVAQVIQQVMQEQPDEQQEQSGEAQADPNEPSENDNVALEKASESPMMATGGPTKYEIFTMEKNMRKAFGGNLATADKSNPETYVQDLQNMFTSHVAKNNTNALIKNATVEFMDAFSNNIPKADLGLEVALKQLNLTMEDYNSAPKIKDIVTNYMKNAPGTTPTAPTSPTSTTSGKQMGMMVDGKFIPINFNPQVQQRSYAQERFALSPLGQMVNAFTGNNGPGVGKVRGRGEARGTEKDFLRQGMTGKTSDGRSYQVDQVERINRFLRPDVTRYHISYDGEGKPVTTPTVEQQQPRFNIFNKGRNERLTMSQLIEDTRLRNENPSSEKNPFFTENKNNDSIPDYMQVNSTRSFKDIVDALYKNPNEKLNLEEQSVYNTNVQKQQEAYDNEYYKTKGSIPKKDFGGSNHIDVKDGRKHPLDWDQFAEGVMGVADQATGFINRINTGVAYEDRFANYDAEKLYQDDRPMDDGFYDQWGNFKPNDRNAPLAGTGDQTVYNTFSKTNFQGNTVMAVGGDTSYNLNDDVDLSPDEEAEVLAHLQKSGYTLKRLG